MASTSDYTLKKSDCEPKKSDRMIQRVRKHALKCECGQILDSIFDTGVECFKCLWGSYKDRNYERIDVTPIETEQIRPQFDTRTTARTTGCTKES